MAGGPAARPFQAGRRGQGAAAGTMSGGGDVIWRTRRTTTGMVRCCRDVPRPSRYGRHLPGGLHERLAGGLVPQRTAAPAWLGRRGQRARRSHRPVSRGTDTEVSAGKRRELARAAPAPLRARPRGTRPGRTAPAAGRLGAPAAAPRAPPEAGRPGHRRPHHPHHRGGRRLLRLPELEADPDQRTVRLPGPARAGGWAELAAHRLGQPASPDRAAAEPALARPRHRRAPLGYDHGAAHPRQRHQARARQHPRDSYVPIPGHGDSKINAAYDIGGPALLAQTVQDVTGLYISHYMGIGLGGLVGVVNDVGGVNMCIPAPLKDKASGLNLKAGCQTLNGDEALSFVRDRHSFATEDLQRIQDQRVMLKALLSKVTSPGTLVNPFATIPAAQGAVSALQVDQGTQLYQLIKVAFALRSPETTTVPIAHANYPTAAGDAVLWDRSKALELFHDLNSDTQPPADLITGSKVG